VLDAGVGRAGHMAATRDFADILHPCQLNTKHRIRTNFT